MVDIMKRQANECCDVLTCFSKVLMTSLRRFPCLIIIVLCSNKDCKMLIISCVEILKANRHIDASLSLCVIFYFILFFLCLLPYL